MKRPKLNDYVNDGHPFRHIRYEGDLEKYVEYLESQNAALKKELDSRDPQLTARKPKIMVPEEIKFFQTTKNKSLHLRVEASHFLWWRYDINDWCVDTPSGELIKHRCHLIKVDKPVPGEWYRPTWYDNTIISEDLHRVDRYLLYLGGKKFMHTSGNGDVYRWHGKEPTGFYHVVPVEETE